MKVEIKQVYGHYAMYINNQFYGNYDTFSEAIKDFEEMKKEKESVA